MNINDIPADVVQVLTIELDRLFKAVGCKPGCHACKKEISVSDEFQLLSFNGTDEMVCALCGRPELEDRDQRQAAEKIEAETKRAREKEEHIQWKHSRGLSGYSRPSQ